MGVTYDRFVGPNVVSPSEMSEDTGRPTTRASNKQIIALHYETLWENSSHVFSWFYDLIRAKVVQVIVIVENSY
jgi:hypothetical protein